MCLLPVALQLAGYLAYSGTVSSAWTTRKWQSCLGSWLTFDHAMQTLRYPKELIFEGTGAQLRYRAGPLLLPGSTVHFYHPSHHAWCSSWSWGGRARQQHAFINLHLQRSSSLWLKFATFLCFRDARTEWTPAPYTWLVEKPLEKHGAEFKQSKKWLQVGETSEQKEDGRNGN